MNVIKGKKRSGFLSADIKHMYQYASGEYLPDSSQPDPNKDWGITACQYTPHNSTRYINLSPKSGDKALTESGGKTRTLPELYTKREDCCGCSACFAICPADAIEMRPCEEGFLYPVVDAKKCIRCYKCLKVCFYKDIG